jgi:hypothetical protein
MEQLELLHHVCNVLERIGVKYLVVGSQATIVYGEPRFTNDIDIVVALDSARLDAFVESFPDIDYYLSRDAAREAIAEHGMFNIIHPASGLKVDVIIPADTAFERSRFDRGRPIEVAPGQFATFASPEDVILKKLEFFRIGGSDRHLRDIAGVLKISGDKVDRSYIAQFAAQFGLLDVWQRALDCAETH